MRTCNIFSYNFDKMGRTKIDLYDLTLVGGCTGFISATFQNKQFDGKIIMLNQRLNLVKK